MKKNVFILGLILTLSFTGLQAQTIIAQGTRGDSLTWIYTSDSTLTINGRGAMFDYGTPPWNAYKPAIVTVILGDSVTTIGNNAFSNCTSLTSVILSDSLTIIGGSSFARCSTLTSINLPNSLTYIGGVLAVLNLHP